MCKNLQYPSIGSANNLKPPEKPETEKIRSYKCNVCGLLFANHTVEQIRLHRLEKHWINKINEKIEDEIKYSIEKTKKTEPKTIKKIYRKTKTTNRQSKYIEQLLKENNKLKTEIELLKNNKNKTENKRGFYDSEQWKRIRYKVISLYGRKCMCCGALDKKIHVDHIKPRSKYPELELDIKNLQVLCEDCNLGKSNIDSTDFRDHETCVFVTTE